MTMLLDSRTHERSGSFRLVHWVRRLAVTSKLTLCVCTLVLFLPAGWSQSAGTPSASPSSSSSTPGEITFGQYRVHQSIEAGYRVSDVTGSGGMFDTLVNEHAGLRLFEQTFSMPSDTAVGQPFDDLFINSVGWGGDPNNFLLMRVSKNQWYDFRASFRRDQNFSDFDLLANPLNPASSNPAVTVDNSPHQFATRRRMSDLDLTLLPKSKVTFRLGFSHNNMTGPSYTTMHEGTEGLLLQPWDTTVNAYRLGVDFKLLPHTVVSYDQFLNYYIGRHFRPAQFPSLHPGRRHPGGLGTALQYGRQPALRHAAAGGRCRESHVQWILRLHPFQRNAQFVSDRATQLARQLFSTAGADRKLQLQLR